jgi:hypothetical protein
LAILFLYLQLFSVHKRTKIFVYINLAISFIQFLAFVIGFGVLCIPLPGETWVSKGIKYQCQETGTLYGLILAVVSVVSDFFLIAIPIPVVWQLQLPTKKKAGVCAIFVTGLL